MLTDEELEKCVSPDGTLNLEPGREYTSGELDQITSQILKVEIKEGRASLRGDNPILFENHIKSRQKREIQNLRGIPDPAFGSGNFFRSHPRGRKINSLERRQKFGASFYR